MGLSKRYTNPEKTAIVILSLGEKAGADLLRRMPKEEAKRVVTALSSMKAVPQEDAAEIVREFRDGLLQGLGRGTLAGGAATAQALVRRAFKGQAAEDLAATLGRSVRLSALDGVDGAQVARVLEQEHPQTIALVVAHAEPRAAADCVKSLAPSLQLEVLLRVAGLQAVDPEVIADLDEHLKQELAARARLGEARVGGAAQAAKILAAMGKDGGAELLDGIEERSPERADEIRALLFTFDDLVRIPVRGMGELHKHTGELWKKALRGASEAVAAHVYGSLSQRAGQMLREDIEAGSKLKATEVAEARQKIMAIVQRLADEGKLEIPQDGEEYV